jgi:hypothetical protein
MEEALRAAPDDLFGMVDDGLVGVVSTTPSSVPAPWTVGSAGPSGVEELDVGGMWARRAHEAATAVGRTGLVPVSDVVALVALRGSPGLGRLVAEPLADLDPGDAFTRDMVRTVLTYLERDRNVDATAGALFVHPNTVRHRLSRFGDLTGLQLDGTFRSVEAWWAARTWLDRVAGQQ